MFNGRSPRILLVLALLAGSVLAADSIPGSVRPTPWLLWDVDYRGYDAAVRALDELERRGTDAIVAELIGRLERGHELRLALEDSLGQIGAAAVPRLAALLERGPEEARRQAAAALGKTRHADAYAPLARVIASSDTTPLIRSQAVGALGSVPGDAVEPLLLQLVRSDQNEVALVAASSLGAQKSIAGLPLIDSLCSRQDDVVRRQGCVGYMGRMGGVEAARLLAQRLRTEPSAYVRLEIANYLGTVESDEVSAVLDAAAAARQWEVIAGAYQYFLRVEPPLDQQLIIEAYRRLGRKDMGEAMRASRRPALVEAVDAEARQPVLRPKLIEVR